MTKKQIKKIILASYTNGKLDEQKIERIVKLLTRSELKEYIKGIKSFENSKEVILVTPSTLTGQFLKEGMEKIFVGKIIQVKKDESLIAGVKIIDNDNVYDFNLRNNLKNLVSYINQ